MNFESFRGALRFEYGVVDNLYFSENNGNVTYTACDRDGPEIAITAPVGEMVTDYANLILERRSGSPCVKSLCDELDAIISAGDDVLYKSYVAARQYGEHAFAWSVAMEVYTDLDGKRKDNNITFKWRINLNALMCWDFISGKRISGDMPAWFNAYVSISDSGKMQIEYSSDNPLCVLHFHMVKMQELGMKPNICQVCGRAFMPVSKANEKYCREKHPDGRTCYDIAMIEKEKDDPFQCIYRKAYKTMTQRACRAKGYSKVQEKNERWRKEAKAKQQECRANNDLAGFTQWIEDSLKQ